MSTLGVIAILVTAGGLVVTLWLEGSRPRLRVYPKMAASTGFILVAFARGALDSTYGSWILGALALSWLGDLFLAGAGRSLFLAGLAAFLAGHLLYCIAFLTRGVDVWWTVAGAAAVATAAFVVLQWLRGHVPAELRRPVHAYVAVISAMVALAVGTSGRSGSAVIVAGAVAFFASDLSVARDRFVVPGVANRLWGLPLYYAAQILFAWSVGA